MSFMEEPPKCPGCRVVIRGNVQEHFEHCMLYHMRKQLETKNARTSKRTKKKP